MPRSSRQNILLRDMHASLFRSSWWWVGVGCVTLWYVCWNPTTTGSGGVAEAAWVGSLLLPHGDFAYDPALADDLDEAARETARKVAGGSRRAARWLARQSSETEEEGLVVLLITPHGIQLGHDFAIYVASHGSGVVTLGNDLVPPDPTRTYNVSLPKVPMDFDLAEDLLSGLQQHGHFHNVSGIYTGNEDTPIRLDWGELIPILLLRSASPPPPYRFLVLSIPHRRYEHMGVDMVPELLALGAGIREWIEGRPEPIAVVVSGDLSHTHEASGPYGFSNASAPFDAAVGKWAGDPCGHAPWLLDTATALQPRAMSCGYTGCVMLQGMLHGDGMVRSTVYANANVTYYGMMAASLEAPPSHHQTHHAETTTTKPPRRNTDGSVSFLRPHPSVPSTS